MPTDRPSSDHAPVPTPGRWADRDHAEIVAELEALLVQGSAGVIATDLDGVITHWTAGAERLYGWSAAEAIGRPVLDLLAVPGDRSIAAANMDTILSDGSWEGEFDVRTKDGGILPAYVRSTVIRDDAGRPVGVLGVSMEASA